MGQSTAQVRQGIERTRDQMSETIDAIADRTSPRRVARRQRRRVGERLHRMRTAVMGHAEEAKESTEGKVNGMKGSARDVKDSARERLASLGDELRHAPDDVRRHTEGSPLAVGIIGFGAGMLAAALVPSSRSEREVVSRARERAEPAMEELNRARQDLARHLKGTAEAALEDVKSSASTSARQVADEAKGEARAVSRKAKASATAVQRRAKGSAKAARRSAKGSTRDRPRSADGDGTSREELYERAQELGIPGRSQMRKEQLAAAVAGAERRRPRRRTSSRAA